MGQGQRLLICFLLLHEFDSRNVTERDVAGWPVVTYEDVGVNRP